MSLFDHMDAREKFIYRDERAIDSERRAARAERFREPTEAEVQAELERREQEKTKGDL